MVLNKSMFTSDKQYWETPRDFFNKINNLFHFNWDLASTNENALCKNHLTEEDDSLSIDWGGLSGNMFLNPPYGRELKLWVKKAAETKLKHNQYLVLLIPARTDTSYWHDYIFNKAKIKFLRGRLKFAINGEQKDAAPFPSALIIYQGE